MLTCSRCYGRLTNHFRSNQMKVTLELLTFLHRKKVAVVFKENINSPGMVSYVTITPVEEENKTRFRTNLMPVIGYQVRFIMHKETYTDEHWGLDYDHVLADESTRVQSAYVIRSADNKELETLLSLFNINPRDFCRLTNNCYNSALLDSPIDAYLVGPSTFPHLQLEPRFPSI